MTEFTLRPYQDEACNAGIANACCGKNGIIVLPTGSGKSLVIAAIAKKLARSTIVLQPTKEILQQNLAKMQAFEHDNIGVYSASMKRKDIGLITMATIGSVIRKKHLFADFDYVFIDECHLVNSKGGMYEAFINALRVPTLGFTATPYRLRSYRHHKTGVPTSESKILTRTRPRIFSDLIHITQVKELADAGYLCPMYYYAFTGYQAKDIKSNSTGAGYDEQALRAYNAAHTIPDRIARLVIDTADDVKHCLAFTQFRSESEEVIGQLEATGVKAVEINADTKPKVREQYIRDFKAGHIRCVVNVGVLTTGFDFPELDAIILGRPTKSVALYYQMVGRGSRPASGKVGCGVYDLCDNVDRFGIIEKFELYDANGNKMWRLKSNKGDLTGVDVTTGESLETIKRRK